MPDYKKKKVSRLKRPSPRKPAVKQPEEKIPMQAGPKRRGVSVSAEEKAPTQMKLVKGKKQQRRRRNGTIACLTAVLLLTALILHIILPVGIAENAENLFSLIGSGGYPVNLESTDTLYSVSRGSYYYVLTDTRLSALTNGGKTVYSHSHGFEAPVLKTSATRALIFDQGGNDAYIYNLHELKAHLEPENEIITAAISDSGVYALATRSASYASVVSVYSKSGKSLYTWYSSVDTVNNIAISPNGKKIAVTAFNAESGAFKSKLCVFEFDSADAVYTKTLDGGPFVTLDGFHNRCFTAATENKLFFVSWSDCGVTEYESDYSLSLLSAGTGGTVAVFNRESDRTDNRLAVFNAKGKLKNEFKLNAAITDISIKNGNIYCISDTEIQLYGSDGTLLRSAECGFGAVRVVPTGSKRVAVVTDNRIDSLELG